jgi:histidyl-tRNA synthetase
MALSTQPYKGARDFFPEDKRLQRYVFGIWRQVVESFGYEEYDAPILEPLDIYLAKTGEEIVNHQTYVFQDRGGRDVVIRPEMTPTVSRMVAARRQELAYPLRWYSIPNLWRYERPQRGRLREHWQLNVDIFGVEDTSAEREMIALVNAIFKAYGADKNMYSIHLNHRALIDYLLHDYLGLKPKSQHDIAKLIDRLHKIDRPTFITKVDEVLTAEQRQKGVAERLLELLDVKDIKDLPLEVRKQPAAEELGKLIRDLRTDNVGQISFDSTLMRGFDYYSGIVFEVFDSDPSNNRSMLGGGRYDGLVGLFGVTPVPTVGFGWGDVTLINFLKTHHLLPVLHSITDIYLISLGQEAGSVAQSLAANLRSKNLNVAFGVNGRKIGDQLKVAGKKDIPFALIVGENEIKSGQYTLKNLANGQETSADIATIVKILQKGRD